MDDTHDKLTLTLSVKPKPQPIKYNVYCLNRRIFSICNLSSITATRKIDYPPTVKFYVFKILKIKKKKMIGKCREERNEVENARFTITKYKYLLIRKPMSIESVVMPLSLSSRISLSDGQNRWRPSALTHQHTFT